jgi:quinol monooxygenase YgiN
MPESLIVVAQLKAKPGREEELRKVALALVEPTRREEGCIRYELHLSDVDAAQVLFYEVWTSRAALDAHMKTAHFAEFLKNTREIVAEPPKVDTYSKIA